MVKAGSSFMALELYSTNSEFKEELIFVGILLSRDLTTSAIPFRSSIFKDALTEFAKN